MSDVPEAWDQDADWLRERFPFLCSEAFVTAFCERVAEKVSAGVNTCITCRHWVRRPHHPLLGDCAKGEPSGCAAGFWGTDRRVCEQWAALDD